jgi:hypothetical protein
MIDIVSGDVTEGQPTATKTAGPTACPNRSVSELRGKKNWMTRDQKITLGKCDLSGVRGHDEALTIRLTGDSS